MSKFITGKDLEKAVYEIIWKAENCLLIVSPYIKLDEYFRTLFNHHENNPKVHIVIVFGKNETDVSRSLSKNDFEYFKKFLNITIIHVPNLHGKYYGNEHCGVVTSINLYDYSFINNIEFGIYSETSLVSQFTSSTDKHAWETCFAVAEENEAVFIKRPMYEKKLFSKNYIKSDVLHDVTDRFYSYIKNSKGVRKTLNDFPEELEFGASNQVMPSREEPSKEMGYCIRTGVKIPFNLEMPYSPSAYKSWNAFKNVHYKENYCHKTGKPTNGKTSFNRPILFYSKA